jgi:class 3 adenylate cyclase/predicted ATPase
MRSNPDSRNPSAMDVAEWLQKLGLERYEPAFRANEIDAKVLLSLTAEDLKDIGVTLVGHRRRLLNAIVSLRAEAGAAAGDESRDVPVPINAERRPLTVMFCDLVGSTALSARLDPEDLRDVIGAYHRAIAEIVAGSDGFVSRYMGDGVLVYFGYPQAHEDDAERAVRAALGAIEAVGRLDVKGVKLQARVGIATGLVVVGDLVGAGSAQEQTVVGETPNLAARLQALAEPDTVVITAGTRRLIGNLFECRDLGTVEVKGIDALVPAWQVLHPGVVESRFEALRGSTLSPLIGRDKELDLLSHRWARAKAGQGQVVLVSGETGLGKSRITAALVERLRSEPHLRLRYFCSPHRQDSALYPFTDQLSRAAGFARDDPPASRLAKLESLMTPAAPPEEDVAFLVDLMSLPASKRHPLPNLSPQRKKERTLKALLRQLEGLVGQMPAVMIFEDAHWSDPTSRELLDLAVERVRGLPVLLIVTFRPEFQPPWVGQPQVSMLALHRLDRRDRIALATHIAGGRTLPAEVIDQIVERTDGVPLFVEELTKSVLESGLLRAETDRYVLDGALPPMAVPTTLHASLLARLDRLASVRLVAQIGAAIGREFSYSLLRTVSRLSEDELRSALDRLVKSELIFERGTPADAVYAFKHALVQDAAHGSLLRSTRQQLHARIAGALETHSPELMNTAPELFAQHYAEAGLAEKSVFYWGEAGRRSAARSAMAEAAAQFEKGLEQLALLPDNRERQQRQLEFLSALGAVLQTVRGLSAPETGRAFIRAGELWAKLDYPSEFLQVPFGQSLYHLYRGEFNEAQRLDESLLQLSRQRRDTGGLVLGHYSSGRNLMLAGRFAPSRTHLEEVLVLYEPAAHQSLYRQAGLAPHVTAHGFLGFSLFCLGHPDQALVQGAAAIGEARKLNHPPSLASSLALRGGPLSFVGYDAPLEEVADQLLAVAAELGFPLWRAVGTIYHGWVTVKKGAVGEGTDLLRGGTDAYRATGSGAWVPYFNGLLAASSEIAGKIEEAMALLVEAEDIVERTGERWFAAELSRRKGELLLRQGHTRTAERMFRNALETASKQDAKMWELRAAASLARLYRDHGKRAAGYELLATVYDWFTEGFDTPDLREAKALLDELR